MIKDIEINHDFPALRLGKFIYCSVNVYSKSWYSKKIKVETYRPIHQFCQSSEYGDYRYVVYTDSVGNICDFDLIVAINNKMMLAPTPMVREGL